MSTWRGSSLTRFQCIIPILFLLFISSLCPLIFAFFSKPFSMVVVSHVSALADAHTSELRRRLTTEEFSIRGICILIEFVRHWHEFENVIPRVGLGLNIKKKGECGTRRTWCNFHGAQIFHIFFFAIHPRILHLFFSVSGIETTKPWYYIRDPLLSVSDGKYHMLPTGELLVFMVNSADKRHGYRCRTVDHVTGATVESSTVARLHVSGKRNVYILNPILSLQWF